MQQQIMVKKYVQKPDKSCHHPAKVGSEAKNPLPAKMNGLNSMDLIGLSWIFVDEGKKVEKTYDVQL